MGTKSYNEYFMLDETTMWSYSRSKTKDVFYFDLEDYDIINYHCWWTSNMGYIYTQIERDTTLLHRLIMGLPIEKLDHIDRNHFNNRKENLRFVTQKQNNRNRSIDHDNKSGFMGVSKTSAPIRNKLYWRARITINDDGRAISKSFEKKEDAVIQRLKWELEYYGMDFSPQRHLFKQYGII